MKIKEFQQLMYDLYFENDRKRGRLGNFVWLVSEIGELARVLKTEDQDKMKEEIADIFAWLASLANVLNIDLEEAVQKKYPGKCPRCRNNPCTCEYKL